METLEHYLANEFPSDKQDITRIERLIREASMTLASKLAEKGWPYSISAPSNSTSVSKAKPSKQKRSPGLSHSTTAMVSLSLWKTLQKWTRPQSIAVSPQFPPIKLDKGAKDKITESATIGTKMLARNLRPKGRWATRSRTYGLDDPTTLSYLAELLENISESRRSAVRSYVRRRVNELKKVNFKKPFEESFFKRAPHPLNSDPFRAVDNAIIPLRVVQTLRMINEGGEQNLPRYLGYFETKLHDQLSFSSIPDSRFDPAELAFCLEGLLLCQRNAVDEILFRRVLDVMAKAQEESAFWRPTKPFLATRTGLALFPVSVEVANSLLRSCEIFDGMSLHDTRGSASIGLFRRYWKWLEARTVRFSETGRNLVVGWHSEHVNERGLIHTWETSQVLEFLIAYHRLLEAHVARKTLILSRFAVREPEREDGKLKKWEKWTTKEKNKTVVKGITPDFESATSLGRPYETYRQIGEHFISGWRKHSPKYFSMLLYGPPGTGKTTIAENMADALGVRMITITVSDFLAGGEAEVESRAKAIFDVLVAQSNCLVLFDEIDSFLLDRDSLRYSKQDTVFQFITPGMLTKINDLRRAKRVLFVISTNYEYRIDPAIKRTGRIDRHYLVLPMDAKARQRTLQKLLEKANIDLGQLGTKQWKSLQDKSAFLSFSDMLGAVSELPKSASITDVEEQLAMRKPTASLANYEEVISLSGDRDLDQAKPWQEFVCMMALGLEVDPTGTSDPQRVLTEIEEAKAVAIKKVKCINKVDPAKALQYLAPGLAGSAGIRLARTLKNGVKSGGR
ncbi:MAG: ATP-binding protein [Xanthobacteraceae bacterium]